MNSNTGNPGMASCPLGARFDVSLPDGKVFSRFSSKIILKLTSWGGVTSVVVGQLWTICLPLHISELSESLQKNQTHLIETQIFSKTAW